MILHFLKRDMPNCLQTFFILFKNMPLQYIIFFLFVNIRLHCNCQQWMDMQEKSGNSCPASMKKLPTEVGSFFAFYKITGRRPSLSGGLRLP